MTRSVNHLDARIPQVKDLSIFHVSIRIARRNDERQDKPAAVGLLQLWLVETVNQNFRARKTLRNLGTIGNMIEASVRPPEPPDFQPALLGFIEEWAPRVIRRPEQHRLLRSFVPDQIAVGSGDS